VRTIDLFAGVGGMSLGFSNAGFEVYASLDNWHRLVEFYTKNKKYFNHEFLPVDLSDTQSTLKVLRNLGMMPECIIGGPPCQDFSHAGKRKEGSRATLTESFADIVTLADPELFVMENVDQAVHSKAFARAKQTLSKAQYGLSQIVLNACFCGVPQSRKRLFLIGHKRFPDNYFVEPLLANLKKSPMTPKKYFNGRLDIEFYYRHPRHYTRRAIYSVNEPAATVRGVNRPIPPKYKKHPNDAGPIKKARPLTTQERAEVQTFPRDIVWSTRKTDAEQMIGNAVPVKMAEYVAKQILGAIKND
jgi:DNA (cytosine-5)-methyltransferase 1